MDIFAIISLAGGLALFLYGMTIMGTGLEKLAGSKMEVILKKLTSSTLMAVISGAVLTGLIQSSSATTVIVIGLVNSGIMKLTQAIGVIMGANIGTTITGQLLRMNDFSGTSSLMEFLKPSTIAPILAFVGAILFVFVKAPRKRNLGQILLGFGILFSGMFAMEAAVYPLRESEMFINFFTKLENPILGILAGTFVTIMIQSSSASVGILQALSTTGVVTWGSAIPIILGQNIGTCSTPLIASIGASKGAKRAAFVHLYFNLIGTAVFMSVIYGIKYTIGIPLWSEVMNRGDIANFHTLFNVSTTFAFIPFTKFLAKLAEKTIPMNEDDFKDNEMPVLDERLFNSPAVAVQQAKSAVEKMATNAEKNYAVAIPVLFTHDAEIIAKVNAREDIIDKLECNISNYIVKVAEYEPSEADNKILTNLFGYITEFERIGDYSINIVERSGEIFDKGIVFSESAKNELLILDEAINEIVSLSVEAFSKNDMRLAEMVEPLEETIDSICDALHTKHVNRLKAGTCAIENGVVFLEVVTNLERIADHCSNVAARIIGSGSPNSEFDAHEMRRKLHNGYVEDFNELHASYDLKYLSQIKDF